MTRAEYLNAQALQDARDAALEKVISECWVHRQAENSIEDVLVSIQEFNACETALQEAFNG